MKDKAYIKKMIVLTEELERAAGADPFDKDNWQSALDEFHLVNITWYKSRRRRPWLMIYLCLFLLYCLAWLVWSILF